MKKIYALLLFTTMWGGVNAQDLINICGYYCQKDLSIPIPNLIIDSTNDANDLTY
ncbi:MAG: hypothetical protein JST21_00755, partial [Bacteroidetes bacterium]|nr:hypothetical protein [Bacteroidota bacterium]